MTGDGADEVQRGDATPTHEADLAVAAAAPETVAAAVSPDDTPEVRTRVDRDAARTLPAWAGGLVRVHVERPTTGGLQATVDDAVVNLSVAERVVAAARDAAAEEPGEASERTDTADEAERTNEAADTDADNDTNT